MTPFPETEIMTLKRIEVALRKKDFKLLKDGAYKLHEKFHGGFKFEFLDVLSDLLSEVNATVEIPDEIREILIPTMEDILNENSKVIASVNQPSNIVSTLTSLSYNTSTTNNKNENTTTQVDAFSAFSPKTSQNEEHTNNQYTTEPFKEFSVIQQNNSNTNIENKDNQYNQTPLYQQSNIQQEIKPIKTENKLKNISIYYNQDNSYEKTKNILRYRELIKKDRNEINLYEVLNLIKEINTQSNTNVSELKGILEKLNSKEHSINLITNSSSANLVQLLQTSDIQYSLINPKDDVKLNLLPLLGLTNLFKCVGCKEEILNNSSVLTSMILECPKCKNPMFPSYYIMNDTTCELDMNCYNQSVIALANSNIWLIINPSIEDKVSQNLFKSALKINSKIEKIFIIHKDINAREQFKKMFLDINGNININTQINVIEDFFNLID